ncbi:MAG: hypothetical protein ACOYXA_10555 [Bacteroidota bacterium]
MHSLKKFLLGIATLSLTFTACKDEETLVPTPVSVTPAAAQFQQSSWSTSENGGTLHVVINLNKPAPQSGTLHVQIAPDHMDKVTTLPVADNGIITVPVEKGSTSTTFRVQSINNSLMDGTKRLTMALVGASSGLALGTLKNTQIDIDDDDAPVPAAFMLNIGTVRENSELGATVMIVFAHPVPASGLIVVAPLSENAHPDEHYRTEPTLVNGKLVLPVAAGAEHVSFNIFPTDNETFNADRSIRFTIESAEGGVKKGDQLIFDLSITDDELANKGKKYETVAGNWRVTRTYEYNEAGNLSKILWEQYTPHYQGGSYTYEYVNGRLHKMVENANRESYYVWEGDRIVKEEQYTHGLLTRLVEYGYDQAGNIGEALFSYRQPNGEMKAGLLNVYLYFTDGNVYKKMVYSPAEDGEPVLIGTHTYDNYMALENPFPMVEILPNVNAQPNLPTTYRYEGNGQDNTYQLTYQFGADGLPTSRTASSPSGSETTVYEYYQ